MTLLAPSNKDCADVRGWAAHYADGLAGSSIFGANRGTCGRMGDFAAMNKE